MAIDGGLTKVGVDPKLDPADHGHPVVVGAWRVNVGMNLIVIGDRSEIDICGVGRCWHLIDRQCAIEAVV